MGIKFRVSHYPEALPAHRYRYAILYNKTELSSSEGYPTKQHVFRAVHGLWKNLAKVFGWSADSISKMMEKGDPFPVPYTRDSLKPGEG